MTRKRIANVKSQNTLNLFRTRNDLELNNKEFAVMEVQVTALLNEFDRMDTWLKQVKPTRPAVKARVDDQLKAAKDMAKTLRKKLDRLDKTISRIQTANTDTLADIESILKSRDVRAAQRLRR